MNAGNQHAALRRQPWERMGFYLLAAALYALGARRLARDWHR